MTGWRAGWLGAFAAAAAAAPLAASSRTWTRLEGPQMVVYSDLGAGAARNWAAQFAQFHRGLRSFLQLDDRSLRPVTVVLFRSDAEFRPYKPRENGVPAQLAGYFIRSEIGNFIAVGGESNRDLRQVIFHESTHWLMSVNDVPVPLWLDEGLAEVFSTFTVADRSCTFGEILPHHLALLRTRGLLPLRQLMRVRRGELQFNERLRTGIFYAESWAFTHYLLFSGDGGGVRKYRALIRALALGNDPDEAFRRLFGADCAGMQERLRQYLLTGRYTRFLLPFDRTALEAEFRVGAAPPAEVELAQCCLLEGADQPAAALPRLAGVVNRLSNQPGVWEADGFAYYELHDYEETRRCFQEAADRGSRNYFVYSFLGDAALGLQPGAVRVGAELAPLPSAVRTAVDAYERALALNPHDAHAYENIATGLYLLSPATPADLEIVARGAALYPADPALQAGVAVGDLKNGRREQGLARLRALAASTSLDDAVAAHFARAVLDAESLRARIDEIQQRWDEHDFAGVQAAVDAALRLPLGELQRRQLVSTRARAGVLILVNRAVDLANGGDRDAARQLLLQADASPDADPALRRQIRQIIAQL